MKWLDSITNSMDMNLSKFWEIVEDRGAWPLSMGLQRVSHDLELINNKMRQYGLWYLF